MTHCPECGIGDGAPFCEHAWRKFHADALESGAQSGLSRGKRRMLGILRAPMGRAGADAKGVGAQMGGVERMGGWEMKLPWLALFFMSLALLFSSISNIVLRVTISDLNKMLKAGTDSCEVRGR